MSREVLLYVGAALEGLGRVMSGESYQGSER